MPYAPPHIPTPPRLATSKHCWLTRSQLVIPKTHGEKLHNVPDDELSELLPVAKKLALATGAADYNILQNNGLLAHQEVGHVHVHMVSLSRSIRTSDGDWWLIGSGGAADPKAERE